MRVLYCFQLVIKTSLFLWISLWIKFRGVVLFGNPYNDGETLFCLIGWTLGTQLIKVLHAVVMSVLT